MNVFTIKLRWSRLPTRLFESYVAEVNALALIIRSVSASSPRINITKCHLSVVNEKIAEPQRSSVIKYNLLRSTQSRGVPANPL